ncbi:PTS sugar transporter subunit IIA [Enterococcus hulanensis]|uniref:PTS sugar transporter subunit IIA n=1 Tax=Enterococcus TaxID=1350 RepID=UPI000B5A50B0|nr:MULTISPECIES: PTS sugar transporter subunit IIA [Enterococcus]MBO0409480.1 PTS sugar transporter subunit IIA [Enterococcus hulanensis]OTO15354.1 hypothetical protein A5875_004512 [Enterococcus sp. 3H8_DIV0648]
MVGVLLISHGKMAEGIKDSIELIMGETKALDTASLVAGQDFEAFKKEVNEKIWQLNDGKGVVVYVDLFGASPYNATMFSFQALQNEGIEIRVLTGMNLPMIMEVLAMREVLTLDELVQMGLRSGKDGIQEPVSDLLTSHVEDDEDGDY